MLNNRIYGYIYKTTNLINNKIYIGQKRGNFNNNYLGSGRCLKSAVRKYGKNKFKLEMVIESYSKREIDDLERKFIAEYRKQKGKKGLYNIADGGNGCVGYKHSKKIRGILKQRQTGKKCPWLYGDKNPACRPEVKEANRLAHLGKKASLKTRIKMSKPHKKMPLRTLQHRLNLSIALQGRESWNKGLTKETDKRVKKYGERQSITKRKINLMKEIIK
jgi:group I intron endonuclease